MAFQRPFLISLKRSESAQKWGFNIKGGSDQGEPLSIHTVVDDSLAERSGLREGDEVIQVGRVNVQDLALGQVYELLARCGNKIEMFVVREDLFSPRKGKEPPVVKAVVHNPYNSPLSLYSTENIAETLAQQTEVLTEGHVSAEEDEGPESLTFKEKSAVFKLLAEQANQETGQKPTRGSPHNVSVSKPRVAPPPPPKPKPPSEEHLYNGYDTQTHQSNQNRVEYQTTQKVFNQYQYQQEQPVQVQQSSVYQVSSQSRSPGYQSPVNQQQQYPGYQSPTKQQTNYQSSYQHSPPISYQQQNSYQQYQKSVNQSSPGYHSPTGQNYQPNYQQAQDRDKRYQQQLEEQQRQQQLEQQKRQQQLEQQRRQQQLEQQQRQQQLEQQQRQQQLEQQQRQQHLEQQRRQQQLEQQQRQHQLEQQQRQQQLEQQRRQQQKQQAQYQKPNQQEQPVSPSVSKAEFKIRPAPPARGSSVKHDADKMTAIYKQQYEQHLQQQYEQQQMMMNNVDEEGRPRAHLINGNIFEHNSTSGTPITYKAPPAAPPKPDWPPPPESARHMRAMSPSGMDVSAVWPPKRSTATEMPRTGFDPNVVRGQGSGRRCVWPPPSDDRNSGSNTPQSPMTGRKIQWNPSPSPPQTRRNIHSPARRKDIQWPPPSPTGNFDKENYPRQSPRLSRKAQFDDYVTEHASINVPQTYRPPPGTQHVEFY